MSQARLRTFLNKLHQEATKDVAYNRATSNKKAHVFEISRKDIRDEIVAQLYFDGITNVEDDQTLLQEIDKFFNTLRNTYSMLPTRKTVDYKFYKSTGRDLIKLRIVANTDAEVDIVEELIKTKKREAQKPFYRFLEKYYKAKNKDFNKDRFLDITHISDSAVIKQRAANVSKKLKSSKLINSAETKELVERYGLDLSIAKYDKLKTIEISIGGAFVNRDIDRLIEEAEVKKALAGLENAIKKLDKEFLNLSGSDSFIQLFRKNIISKVVNAFKKISGIIIRTEDTKPKRSSTKKVTKKIRPSVTGEKTNIGIDKIPKIKTSTTQNPTITLQALIPIINQRLSEQIAKNMGSPRLNWRTGRFANSARVLGVHNTKEGVPSLTYTYQRDPYGVFEVPGGDPRLATVDRDPRNIIGLSIREIAAGLINQRFQLRRF